MNCSYNQAIEAIESAMEVAKRHGEKGIVINLDNALSCLDEVKEVYNIDTGGDCDSCDGEATTEPGVLGETTYCRECGKDRKAD